VVIVHGPVRERRCSLHACSLCMAELRQHGCFCCPLACLSCLAWRVVEPCAGFVDWLIIGFGRFFLWLFFSHLSLGWAGNAFLLCGPTMTFALGFFSWLMLLWNWGAVGRWVCLACQLLLLESMSSAGLQVVLLLVFGSPSRSLYASLLCLMAFMFVQGSLFLWF